MIKYHYFISFTWHTKEKPNIYTGNIFVNTDKRIKNYNALSNIEDFIEKENEIDGVVIMNYKLMGVSFGRKK